MKQSMDKVEAGIKVMPNCTSLHYEQMIRQIQRLLNCTTSFGPMIMFDLR